MSKAVKDLRTPNTEWVEVGPAAGLTVAGIECNEAWLNGLSPDELTDLGLSVVEVDEIEAPAGERAINSSVQDVEGIPTRVWDTEEYTVEETSNLRAAKVNEVRVEANARILERFPLTSQLNMVTTAVELADTRIDRVLTAPEQIQRVELKAAFAWIRSIRAASNTIEAAIPEDAEGICNFVVPTHPDWPE